MRHLPLSCIFLLATLIQKLSCCRLLTRQFLQRVCNNKLVKVSLSSQANNQLLPLCWAPIGPMLMTLLLLCVADFKWFCLKISLQSPLTCSMCGSLVHWHFAKCVLKGQPTLGRCFLEPSISNSALATKDHCLSYKKKVVCVMCDGTRQHSAKLLQSNNDLFFFWHPVRKAAF